MRWVKLGFGVAVLSLLAWNLRAQVATQRKLDALAAVPAPPAVVTPPAESPQVALSEKDAAYVIEAPDILTIDARGPKFRQLDGQHIVRPDGTIGLGEFGNVSVADLTLAAARKKLNDHLSKFADRPTAELRVHTVNSKAYYVIAEFGDGEQVTKRPCLGNETVLDAVGAEERKDRKMRVWVARKTPKSDDQVLPVDLAGILNGNTKTNYQLLPGDRVYLLAAK